MLYSLVIIDFSSIKFFRIFVRFYNSSHSPLSPSLTLSLSPPSLRSLSRSLFICFFLLPSTSLSLFLFVSISVLFLYLFLFLCVCLSFFYVRSSLSSSLSSYISLFIYISLTYSLTLSFSSTNTQTHTHTLTHIRTLSSSLLIYLCVSSPSFTHPSVHLSSSTHG